MRTWLTGLTKTKYEQHPRERIPKNYEKEWINIWKNKGNKGWKGKAKAIWWAHGKAIWIENERKWGRRNGPGNRLGVKQNTGLNEAAFLESFETVLRTWRKQQKRL